MSKRAASLSRLVVFSALVLASCGLLACSQAEGERCQVEGDCQDGLICCVRDNTSDRIVGGVCTKSNKCELDFADSGVSGAKDASTSSDPADGAAKDGALSSVDLTVADAGPDSAEPVDGAPPADAVAPDTVLPDMTTLSDATQGTSDADGK